MNFVAQRWIYPSFLGEIIKALEQSEALVPAELREVWDNYKQKQAEDGKSVKTGGGGFGGSGFKFDESEAAYTSEKKKFQKTVFGLQDSDDEDVEGEIDDQIEVRNEWESFEGFLRKLDFKLFHYKTWEQPESKITTIATINRC